ncbi:MAG: hypothetical protein ACRDQ5_07795 [Sciscionella sp.]
MDQIGVLEEAQRTTRQEAIVLYSSSGRVECSRAVALRFNTKPRTRENDMTTVALGSLAAAQLGTSGVQKWITDPDPATAPGSPSPAEP